MRLSLLKAHFPLVIACLASAGLMPSGVARELQGAPAGSDGAHLKDDFLKEYLFTDEEIRRQCAPLETVEAARMETVDAEGHQVPTSSCAHHLRLIRDHARQLRDFRAECRRKVAALAAGAGCITDHSCSDSQAELALRSQQVECLRTIQVMERNIVFRSKSGAAPDLQMASERSIRVYRSSIAAYLVARRKFFSQPEQPVPSP